MRGNTPACQREEALKYLFFLDQGVDGIQREMEVNQEGYTPDNFSSSTSYPRNIQNTGAIGHLTQALCWGGHSQEMNLSLQLCIKHVQFSSVTQSCPTLCDPMNRSTPGLPVHHQLLEFTQTHVHRVGDTIQPSHPLWSPSPPAPNPSQHQSLF